MEAVGAFARPYVVSWNLTYRCNLACEHCYLDAGGKPEVDAPAFADRSELTTQQCFKVIDDIVAFAPEAVTILTGGEPLLRRDILEIVRYANGRGLWVVVGTNGVKITPTLAALLLKEGVRGLSLSLDALDPERHDRFRRVTGAWRNTVEGARILKAAGLPFTWPSLPAERLATAKRVAALCTVHATLSHPPAIDIVSSAETKAPTPVVDAELEAAMHGEPEAAPPPEVTAPGAA